MAAIFVSYRRHDTAAATGRLCDKLEEHFGTDAVFRDLHSIEAGEDFAATIKSTIEASTVMLVMIGPRWLEIGGDDGRPRLFEPADYVRLEIEAGLQRTMRIIPVLVEGATMPPASVLPDSIRALAARQAHEISELRWQYDTDRLLTQLEKLVPPVSGSIASESTAGLGKAVLRSLTSYVPDFIELLVHPRRQIAAMLQRPHHVARALLFFVLSHLASAWMFMLEEFVASAWEFVLSGVPLGMVILGALAVPLNVAAKLVRARSDVRTTTVVLAYLQSGFFVLLSTGVAALWTGLLISDPEAGPKLRAAFADPVIQERIARVSAVAETAVSAPFLVAFVLAVVIWLYAFGWLAAGTAVFRDVWAVSRLRMLAAIGVLGLILSVVAGLVLFVTIASAVP